MDKFLQVVGWVGIAVVAAALLAVIVKSGTSEYALLALLGAMTWALPAVIGFVIIAAFGSMLSQLKAIRAASERQADIFYEIISSRKRPGA
ncbi:hypothetical protein DSM25558_0164 [Agrobacterium sp. DSM 25558]|uniref:hypothetical protein n=1 Tax=Agrobacterium sp. DSM 25558 TaxID=1907665 RepID=UPI0009724C68|nr:hypothetical protein [Agrobacterium sp. DSM 25558]SCX00705.1 hypothetical protein DSM25558_0164 [Agrobacterium sp. DSM 25558]